MTLGTVKAMPKKFCITSKQNSLPHTIVGDHTAPQLKIRIIIAKSLNCMALKYLI